MVLALLGALAVLGLGAWIAAQLRHSYGEPDPNGYGAPDLHGAAPAPALPDQPAAGGYTLLDGGADPRSGHPVADRTLSRVRGLLAEGRGNEAVGAVRDATGCDARRAEEIVADIRRSGQP